MTEFNKLLADFFKNLAVAAVTAAGVVPLVTGTYNNYLFFAAGLSLAIAFLSVARLLLKHQPIS